MNAEQLRDLGFNILVPDADATPAVTDGTIGAFKDGAFIIAVAPATISSRNSALPPAASTTRATSDGLLTSAATVVVRRTPEIPSQKMAMGGKTSSSGKAVALRCSAGA